MNLFREMQKRHFDFVWVCDQRVDLVSSKLMTEMRKAGCRTMALGIESANQRILDFFNKKITPDMSIKATKKVKKAGIDFVMGTFVIGAPTETLKEIKNTLSFARKLDIDFPQFHIFGAIPGTEIWDKLVQEGKIDPDKYWENGVKTLVPPLDIVQEEMRKAYLNFLLRPKYILSQALRTLKSMHRWKIIFSNLDSFSSYRTMRNFYEFTTEMWTHGVEGE